MIGQWSAVSSQLQPKDFKQWLGRTGQGEWSKHFLVQATER
jgi:hypothetical protein